jgi:hypothetical protein
MSSPSGEGREPRPSVDSLFQSAHPPRAARTKPLGVKNGAFLIEKLHDDCAPGQFIREFTKNAEQAISNLADREGAIVWDVALFLRDFPEYGAAPKLMVIDTGCGMSPEQLLEYMNNLSSSGNVQGFSDNFGVGAKISALPLNTNGLLICSWQKGEGWLVWIWKDPLTGDYGLRPMPASDGSFSLAIPAPEGWRPKQIVEHGTIVVFLGRDAAEDTLCAPPGVPAPREWIFRYLNERFFRFPPNAAVQVRDRYDRPDDRKHFALLSVSGMEKYLERRCKSSGIQDLEDVRVNWWLMRDDVDLDAAHYPSPGHYAALFQDELYDFTGGRGAMSFLQNCGITFGYKQVVLYFEPKTSARDVVTPSISRTRLQIRGQDLPWDEWADDFRGNLPKALVDHVAAAGANASETDHTQSIEERLRALSPLYRLSRYKPSASGDVQVNPNALTSGRSGPDRSREADNVGGNRSSRSRKTGAQGDSLLSFLTSASGVPAVAVGGMPYPKVDWITIENGTREREQIPDRAAEYISATNQLLINADCRVFVDMVKHWAEHYRSVPGAKEHVRQIVREWFEQQLVEAIVGAHSFRRSPEWNEGDLRGLWSPEALTAVVCPRYHVYYSIKRRLHQILGKSHSDGTDRIESAVS